MHLEPTAGCQISILVFENNSGGGSLWISHDKYIKDGKILSHFEFKLKVFFGSLTDISNYVG